MNSKALIIGLVTTALLLSGCSDNSSSKGNLAVINNNDQNNSYTSSVIPTNEDDTIININTENFVTVGEIIEIQSNEVHIITGDVAEIFNVSNDDLKNFYLGQIVSVTEEGENEYSLMPYNNTDFMQNYTSMGQIITRLSGTVISRSDESAVLMTENGELTVNISPTTVLEENAEYEFDIIEFEENDLFLFNAYHMTSKLTLTITDLNRLENGELQVSASDNNNGNYTINTYSAVKNFNLTDLSIGQELEVYPNSIMESYPVQIIASRIDLISEVIIGTTSIDYDVIGIVIEMKGNEVHILQGDMIEIFNIDSTLLVEIYLGQTVKLYNKENTLFIEPYIIDDMSVTHTNMGIIVTTIEGLVTKVTPNEDGHAVHIETSEGVSTYILYGDNIPEENKLYEFDTMSYDGKEVSIISFYDPESIIEITITSLSRADNGELMFNGNDESDGEYTIGTSRPLKNFNLSELEVGDVLEVYADDIMESWPMQVNTRKINKK